MEIEAPLDRFGGRRLTPRELALVREVVALEGERTEVWAAVEPFLVPGRELRAKYAFADLWEAERGFE